MNAKTYSAAIPAVSFEQVTGGTRVRREGKGDTFLVVRDDRCRRNTAWLIIHNGSGVVGRVAQVDGDWFTETGVFRHWDAVGTPYQVFPSSTVRTDWGYANFEDAVAEVALDFLI